MEYSGCPESKKQYPGDCRLFYKCVSLSEAAHAYVWVPSRCSAGLVFHPTLKQCIMEDDYFNCYADNENMIESQYFQEVNELGSDFSTVDHFGMQDYETEPTTTHFESTLESSSFIEPYHALNGLQQDQVPLSMVDNISMDRIGTQMSLLTKLIGTLRPTTITGRPLQKVSNGEVSPIEYGAGPQKFMPLQPIAISPSFSSIENKVDLVLPQVNKLTAQLVMQNPIAEKLSDLHVLKETSEVSPLLFNPNTSNYSDPQDIVTFLFRKYLTNKYFMKDGEYIKRNSAAPVVTFYNSMHQALREDIHQNTTVSTYTNSNSSKELYGKSCLKGIRLPNPQDCTRYFLCNASTISFQSYTCPPNMAFNKTKRICDVREYQRCKKEIEENREVEKIENYNEIPCDSYMCGGLQNFDVSKHNQLKCVGTLKFCTKKQKCLPSNLC
ncbi:uncharacterized protein LOC116165377 [Photinus pyralis]|uniref:uncharacterized protein LOC116165377 n=1 Tax=Photinus pyralis TaxID=7054 RepID=UPI00126742CE|nr:uncharacterized protein LOC116165377 [Photinus pyralis]